jgi:hypothetical protein
MMSDEIIVKETASFDRELPPAGPASAVCWKVFDVGIQPNSQGDPYHMLVIYFELDHRYKTGLFKDKRILIFQRYRASLGKKAYLRRDLESWRGKPFTEEELKGFNVKKVEGVFCLLNIVHQTKGDNTYANVSAIMRLPENYTPLQLEVDPSYMPEYIVKLREKAIPEKPMVVELAGVSNDSIPF